ncbi:hypothetical protein [Dyadobacter sp. CY312]|uniref:hypothetical protein n=1 Tax=Dyadobacter sp. CY312 TaxID=2907303 RepID=UPI001F36AD5A|nr:hypothetical protein [Dyadobacter sp. CY312]MCE7039240.1 hypothetical protein [Dyadobacter sp. CY312]
MANPLLSQTVKRRPRKLVLDMPFKNDMLLDSNIFTSIVMSENPGSIMSMLGFGFGENMAIGEHSDPMFQMKTVGIASNYIKIKEICEKREPLRVVDNSKVPDDIPANAHVQVTLQGPVLDADENVHLRDERGFARVISRRVLVDGKAEYTLQMSGLPGEIFSGRLFEVGAPINHRFGNSKGEASPDSNLLSGDANQSNTFYNPLPITRYKLPITGDYMSDEMITVASRALDGSSEEEYNTGLPRKWFRQVLASMENQILYSTANFNPNTFEIGGRNNNSSYPERPSYAGIMQQLDQASFKWTHSYKDNYLNGIQKIDRILQTLFYMPGTSNKYFAMCRGNGAQWLRNVLKQGGLANSPVRITISPDKDDAIVVGFKVEKYVDALGNSLYIYDIGKNMLLSNGDYDLTTYDGMKGSPRSNDIFFFSATSEIGGRPKSKIAKLFAKEGQGFGNQKVNRGFVFGVSRGITGAGNGFSGAQAMSMTEATFEEVIRNSSRYQVQSLVDGDEYHALWQTAPYIDPRGVCKLSLS